MRSETLYTTGEVARIYRVRPRTVRGWIDRGLQFELAGDHYRFRLEDLHQWHEQKKKKKQAKPGRGARQRRKDSKQDEQAALQAGLTW